MKSPSSPFLLAASVTMLLLASACTQTAQASVPAAEPTPTATATPTPDRPWLGLRVATLTEQVAKRLDIPRQDGVAVFLVVADSPGDAAGVQRKDVITAINGTAVASTRDVHKLLHNIKPGDKVQLGISRGGQSLTVTVTAGTAPAPVARFGVRRALFGLPILQDLQGVPREEVFDHLMGQQFTLKNKDGKQIIVSKTYGKVVSASDTSLTVTPNGQSQQVTYQITSNTKSRTKTADLQKDDKVVIITKNGATEAFAVISLKPRPAQQSKTQSLREAIHRFRGLAENSAFPFRQGFDRLEQGAFRGISPTT